MKAKIGIRPVIDGRWGGIREGLEEQTMRLAQNAKKLIEENVFYADGTPCQVVISPCTIGGGAEAYECEQFFHHFFFLHYFYDPQASVRSSDYTVVL